MKGDLTTLRRFMPPAQRHLVDETIRLTGLSEGAAVALSLCREAIRDWCPASEHTKVMAFLLSLEAMQP